MYNWLVFRLLQVFRMLKAAGWGILAVLFALVLPLTWQGWLALGKVNLLYGTLGMGVGVGLLHVLRTDFRFLQKGRLPIWQYALVDYALLAALFASVALANGNWQGAIGLLLGCVWPVLLPLGWAKGHFSASTPWKLDFLPPYAYEWKAILRTQWPILLLAALLVLPTCIHIGFYAVAMVLALMSTNMGYEYLEPYAMLPATRPEAVARWRANARWMYVWLVPTAIYALICYPDWWPLVVYVVLSYEAYLALLTAYRLLAWMPGRRRIYGGAVNTVAGFAVIMPGGLLVLLPMALWYGVRAWKRLHRFGY